MRKNWIREEVAHGAPLALLLGLILAWCFPYFGGVRNANELPRLAQGIALVEHQTFSVTTPSTSGWDLGPDLARGEDGRLYPNKPPGTSLMAAVAYAGARAVSEPLDLRTYTLWARLLGGWLPTVLLCGFAVRFFSPTYGRAPVALAVALYALATPATSYAHLLYGHQLAACLLLVGTVLVSRGASEIRPREAALGGGIAALAVGVEYAAAFAALPIAVGLAFTLRHRGAIKSVGAAVGAALVPVALLALYHDAAFGSPTATGYHNVIAADFAQKHGEGFLGLGMPRWDRFVTHVLDPAGGLLWWAPLVPLGLWGLLAAGTERTEHRLGARVMLAAFGLFVLVVSSLSFEGGWRVGPRYLVVVLPFLILGWARIFSEIRTSWIWTGAALTLGTYATLVNGLAANLWPHLDLSVVRHPVPDVLFPLWDAGYQPYNLEVWWLGGQPAAVTHVGVAAVAVVAYLFLRNTELGARTTVAWIAGVGLGFVLFNMVRVWPAHPRAAANLDYIQRQWEPASRGGGSNRPSRVLRTTTLATDG